MRVPTRHSVEAGTGIPGVDVVNTMDRVVLRLGLTWDQRL